jgi:hypothetical protein
MSRKLTLRLMCAASVSLCLITGSSLAASSSFRVESFHPTTNKKTGGPGKPSQNPGDPPNDFVRTLGRMMPKNSVTFYVRSEADRARLPQVIQDTPEAAAAVFKPAPAAVIARDGQIISAMKPLVGGKVHASTTNDPTKANVFIFGSSGLASGVLQQTRRAVFTAIPSEVAFSWVAVSTTEPLSDVVLSTTHESGHYRYGGLDDNNPDAYYDIPGICCDTNGLSIEWSFLGFQHQADDVSPPSTRLDAYDIQIINRAKYWNNPVLNFTRAAAR